MLEGVPQRSRVVPAVARRRAGMPVEAVLSADMASIDHRGGVIVVVGHHSPKNPA